MALFSKRHYKAIAKVLYNSRRKIRIDKDTVDCVARDLADMFSEDNPSFDYNKFLDAIEGVIGTAHALPTRRVMLYTQIFKTLAGAQKRAAFERAHAGDRGNVNYRFFVVRCINGVPDNQPFQRNAIYDYRIERTLSNFPTDPRSLLEQ